MLTSIFGSASREETQADDQLESNAKASVKSSEPLSGDTRDWTAWKTGTRLSLGLMDLNQALDDRDHTTYHQAKSMMVHYLL